MAIPYIDTNPLGNGYYSFAREEVEIGVFLRLPGALVVSDHHRNVLRGPNWKFFGPYEYWDANKIERW